MTPAVRRKRIGDALRAFQTGKLLDSISHLVALGLVRPTPSGGELTARGRTILERAG